MAAQKCLVEYNFLSKNCGLKVSNICFGTATFGESKMNLPGQCDRELAHRLLDRFVEAGGNFIDTANIYSEGKAEEYIGSWLKLRQNRDKMVIVTKGRFPTDPGDPNADGLSRKHILRSLEDSLRRLQTDYIDLYLIHCWDDAVPLRETLSTLDGLVRAGKVRYVGGCNLMGWQLQKIIDINNHMGYTQFVALQQEYNLMSRYSEHDAFEVCQREGLGVLPWGPLKRGLLTGKVKKGEDFRPGTRLHWAKEYKILESAVQHVHTDRCWTVLDTKAKISNETGKTMAQVALRWLLQQNPVSSVLIGPKTMDQLEENLGAGTGWELSQEQVTRLNTVTDYEKGDLVNFVLTYNQGRERRLVDRF